MTQAEREEVEVTFHHNDKCSWFTFIVDGNEYTLKKEEVLEVVTLVENSFQFFPDKKKTFDKDLGTIIWNDLVKRGWKRFPILRAEGVV